MLQLYLFTHASGSRCIGRVISSVCYFVCVTVRALKGKWLELSTSNMMYTVHTYTLHALQMTPRSKGHVAIKYTAGMVTQVLLRFIVNSLL